jgi:hypothetical protein
MLFGVLCAAIEGSGMGLPLGMARRGLSYDDNMEAPMSTPPLDVSINNPWRRPVIPERRFSHLAEVRKHAMEIQKGSKRRLIVDVHSLKSK